MEVLTTNKEEMKENSLCCFFCAMKQQNPRRRRAALSSFFNSMPHTDDESHVLVMSSLWSMAMTHPDDPEVPSSGALHCMSLLIAKSLEEPSWLLLHQNIYIPYYAAHIIGSYTIRSSSLAELAVEAGAVPLLLELLRGRLSWVEQRVAARALGHLASYEATFQAVALHGEEVITLAMSIASSCLKTVYTEFLLSKDRKKYQCDLLTRGLGGKEMEDRKAEEWASQLQCWSLYLLSCFAFKDKSCHLLICRDLGFLRELCRMWGGMVNGESPAGVGLMRILCRSSVGREAMAGCSEVVQSLCNLSRSSDDWQYMGIDCLVLLLKDSRTRLKVLDMAADCLIDLVELKNLGARKKVGKTITKVLLMDSCDQIDGRECVNKSTVDRLWELKVERRRREEMMPEEELVERWSSGEAKKKQGNERFYAGDIEVALGLYTQALELCPMKRRKERLVLYSNRAQCCLLLQDADGAVSNATKALCLSSPANCHGKSLWRRSQAYDMKGMAKESLMDCIMFVNLLVGEKREKKGKMIKVPYYAARMINKQMNSAGLFTGVLGREGGISLSTIEEEEERQQATRRRKRWIKKGKESGEAMERC